MEHIVTLISLALTLDKMASLILLAIGSSLVYVIIYRIPPMVQATLESVSKSLERISVTMAEIVMSSAQIGADVKEHNYKMTVHHENAVNVKEVVAGIADSVDNANRTLDRIEVTLNNRPCLK